MATRTLTQRVTRLEAITEIQQLVGRYAHGADRHNDAAVMAPLFGRNAVWEAKGFGRHQGREVIAMELARIGREEIVWSAHYMTPPVIDVDDDLLQARCRWHLWELAQIQDASGSGMPAAAHWICGEYDTIVIVEAGRWCFQQLDLNLRLIHRHDAAWLPLG
ncbi:nuclear transport factor 2 family protein [Diaphorobacter sp. HDW4A]|uniref:nuclear transport factor 2 family protein n=1 Tax=Diaphorobacter sp. HDW4A TaxID=2714924 RepID=UPI00140763FC|nr:nuclear transport factor 2 family protein [Diaphorobacter sp. HDW4A]QIL80779.1 nuclear transport factor 2 family protein [Diaphorobacter sp. HDW4A]